MAELKATRAQDAVSPITTDAIGVPVIVDSFYTWAAGTGPAQNDTIVVGEHPPGYELIPDLCRVFGDELDSNASPTGTLHLGYADDADAIIASGALGNAAGFYCLEPSGAALATAYKLGISDDARTIIATFPTAFATVVNAKTITFRLAFKARQPTY
jgi:hypothetical protein